MSTFDPHQPPDPMLEDALKRWANDTGGYQPLDSTQIAMPIRRSLYGWWTAATLAAAAMVVFALAQVSFSVSLGDATLQWGESSDNHSALAGQLAEAESRIAQFERQLSTHAEAISSVAAQNVLLGESLHVTAVELAQRQELESAARVIDMQNLVQFVSYQQ